jgi:hypothetical protein
MVSVHIRFTERIDNFVVITVEVAKLLPNFVSQAGACNWEIVSLLNDNSGLATK